MSTTIKAIERHMIIPSKAALAQSRGLEDTTIVGRLCQTPFKKRRLTETAYNMPAKLVGEWQQHGPETLSGNAIRKLRLVLAPSQSVITASAAG